MKELIEKALNEAIDTLVRADFELLQQNVHERSICHRLAIYLEPYFPGWNIDCEYNRNLNVSKRLKRLMEKLNIPPEIKIDDTQPPTVFPDIIIHRRNTNKNLLVIEMKKTSSRVIDEFDIGKLEAFKSLLHYQFAAFIKIRTGEDYDIGTNNVEITLTAADIAKRCR